MTRNINWFRTDHPPILMFAASELIILEWLGKDRPPTLALIPANRATTGAALGVTTVCTSTGAAGAAGVLASGGTDDQQRAVGMSALGYQRKAGHRALECPLYAKIS